VSLIAFRRQFRGQARGQVPITSPTTDHEVVAMSAELIEIAGWRRTGGPD
jgi:hypothetical protein